MSESQKKEAKRLVETLIYMGFFKVRTSNVTPMGQIRLSKLYDYLSMSDMEKEQVINQFTQAVAICKVEELEEIFKRRD